MRARHSLHTISSAILTVALSLSCLVVTSHTEARKISTRLKPGRGKSQMVRKKDNCLIHITPHDKDSAIWSKKIVFAGYDKQLHKSTESFFISNHTDTLLKSVKIAITYHDMHGAMLHEKTEKIDADIPPGETRKADIRSFDTQGSFYYHLSPKPRKGGIPFDTRIRILEIWFGSAD